MNALRGLVRRLANETHSISTGAPTFEFLGTTAVAFPVKDDRYVKKIFMFPKMYVKCSGHCFLLFDVLDIDIIEIVKLCSFKMF